MAFNANEFRSSFQRAIASPALFEMDILSIPDGISIPDGSERRKQLKFRCQTANLPARTIGTTSRRTNGIERLEVPYGQLDQDPLTVDILATDGMDERKFFDQWMKQMTDPGFGNNARRYQPLYHDDIVTTIEVKHFTKTGEIDYVVVFEEAYPTSITETELDWGSTDEILSFQVQFSYFDWNQGLLAQI